jgi:hypothetical protein
LETLDRRDTASEELKIEDDWDLLPISGVKNTPISRCFYALRLRDSSLTEAFLIGTTLFLAKRSGLWFSGYAEFLWWPSSCRRLCLVLVTENRSLDNVV